MKEQLEVRNGLSAEMWGCEPCLLMFVKQLPSLHLSLGDFLLQSAESWQPPMRVTFSLSLRVCVCASLSKWAYPLCLSMWMSCMHTTKRAWLVLNVLSLLYRELNKSCVCIGMNLCACIHVHSACVCGQTSCRLGLLLSPKARIYLGGWFSVSPSPSEWLRVLPADWERPTTGICCLHVSPLAFR